MFYLYLFLFFFSFVCILFIVAVNVIVVIIVVMFLTTFFVVYRKVIPALLCDDFIKKKKGETDIQLKVTLGI